MQLKSLIIVGVIYAITMVHNVALANPLGGNVAEGSANIEQNGSKTDIHQHSQKVIIDWQSFNIDANEHTEFHQPTSSSIALNRVNDVNPTKILGKLTANGQVILINPNGVFFSEGSRVDVGGLIATTSDIDNDKFMKNDILEFKRSHQQNQDAKIENRGTITAKEGGIVGLVSPVVENHGAITAKLGKVELASSDMFTLDLYGDGLIEVALTQDAKEQIIRNGDTGKIIADGGRVRMLSSEAHEAVNSIIEVGGEVYARSIDHVRGNIEIKTFKTNRGHEKILIDNAIISASGLNNDEKGGNITIAAGKVALVGNSTIDASGHREGGNVLIGTTSLDKKEPANLTYVDKNVKIKANASKDKGDGGNVRVFATNQTQFYGSIEAKGGNSGKGGVVDVSGLKWLNFQGSVDLSAVNGTAGILTLDPEDIVICDFLICNPLVNIITGPTGNVFNAINSVTTSFLDTTVLQNLLATANTTVRTGNDANSTITVQDPVSWTTNRTLTFDATGTIFVDAAVTGRNIIFLGKGVVINSGGSVNPNSVGLGNVEFRKRTSDPTPFNIATGGTDYIDATSLSRIGNGFANMIFGQTNTSTPSLNFSNGLASAIDLSGKANQVTFNSNGAINISGMLLAKNLVFLGASVNLAVANSIAPIAANTHTIQFRKINNVTPLNIATGGSDYISDASLGNIGTGYSNITFGTNSNTTPSLNFGTTGTSLDLSDKSNRLTFQSAGQVTMNGTLTAKNLTFIANNVVLTDGNSLVPTTTGFYSIQFENNVNNATMNIATGASEYLTETSLNNLGIGFASINFGAIGNSRTTSIINFGSGSIIDLSSRAQLLQFTGNNSVNFNGSLISKDVTFLTTVLNLNVANSLIRATNNEHTIQFFKVGNNNTMNIATGSSDYISAASLDNIQSGYKIWQFSKTATPNNSNNMIIGTGVTQLDLTKVAKLIFNSVNNFTINQDLKVKDVEINSNQVRLGADGRLTADSTSSDLLFKRATLGTMDIANGTGGFLNVDSFNRINSGFGTITFGDVATTSNMVVGTSNTARDFVKADHLYFNASGTLNIRGRNTVPDATFNANAITINANSPVGPTLLANSPSSELFFNKIGSANTMILFTGASPYLSQTSYGRIDSGFEKISFGNANTSNIEIGDSMTAITMNLNKATIHEFNSNLKLGGNLTSSSFIFNQPITLVNNSSLTANDGLNFNTTIDGNHDLTLEATSGQDIIFNQAIGFTTALNNLIIKNARNVESLFGIKAASFEMGDNINPATVENAKFAGTGIQTTGNISIKTLTSIYDSIFNGMTGYLNGGTNGITNTTVTFTDLDLGGSKAILTAGSIGTGSVNQEMANRISINQILFPNLIPSNDFTFAGFLIGDAVPSTVAEIQLPDSVKAFLEQQGMHDELDSEFLGCTGNTLIFENGLTNNNNQFLFNLNNYQANDLIEGMNLDFVLNSICNN